MPIKTTLLLLFSLLAGVFFLPIDALQLERWVENEDGPVQQLSAAAWWITALICFLTAVRVSTISRAASIDWLLGAAILMLFGARELDLNVWLSQQVNWNIEKLYNYGKDGIPLNERLNVVGLLIVPSLCIITIFAYRMWGRFRKAWQDGVSWARDFLLWAIVLVGAILLDKWDPSLDLSYRNRVYAVEETLELFLALFTILVVGRHALTEMQLNKWGRSPLIPLRRFIAGFADLSLSEGGRRRRQTLTKRAKKGDSPLSPRPRTSPEGRSRPRSGRH